MEVERLASKESLSIQGNTCFLVPFVNQSSWPKEVKTKPKGINPDVAQTTDESNSGIFLVVRSKYWSVFIENVHAQEFMLIKIACSSRSNKKLPMSKIFHLNMAGYWLKFSTSNNRTSLVGH